MYDFVYNVEVLRVYQRNSTMYDVAKNDYVMPTYSRTKYFIFPNYYLNLIWYRDEILINITLVQDKYMVVNATNQSLIKSVMDKDFMITLEIYNDFDVVTQNFSL